MLITLKGWSINTDCIVTVDWSYGDKGRLINARISLNQSSMKGAQQGIADELYLDNENELLEFRKICEQVHKRNIGEITNKHIDMYNADIYK